MADGTLVMVLVLQNGRVHKETFKVCQLHRSLKVYGSDKTLFGV